MSYTQRQQQLLKAMGFVPWVQRESSTALAAKDVQHLVDSSVLEQSIDVTAANGGPEAEIAPALADTSAFASRPLCALANGFSIGHAQAPLLVVVETTDMSLKAPLTGDAAQLFEQMMRSIDVTRGSVCQCAVLADGGEAESGQATVSSLVSTQLVAGLLLCHEIDDLEAASAHAFSLPLAGRNALPMWRIPHPDILLTQPLKKRQAWQALKAVRQILRP